MARIRWTLQALDDIDAICDFIARDAPRTAKKFGQRLYEAVEPLERFPQSGLIVPELGRSNIRELRLKKYRIIYRLLDKETVEILTVYHSARLLDLDLLLTD
ncbi:MAG: type II toxin-antitoxin system RelE/ParE family toxin [Thermoanaerobaculia bacterium]|nr:type II toxin-antitoxin system RelE/ParE family toxin [Thermoanaerobaculia bacterium]